MSEKFTPGQMTTPAYRWFKTTGNETLWKFVPGCRWPENVFDKMDGFWSEATGKNLCTVYSAERFLHEIPESEARKLFPEAFK